MRKHNLIIVLLFIFSLNNIKAQLENTSSNLLELSIEELMNVQVTTSSRKKEKLEDAPNVMYVITEEEIKSRGYKSYLDILTTIPGLNAFHGDFGYLSQVRGVAPNLHNKVTYMINGRQVNQLLEANMLTGPVTLDNAKRVEIIVGPGSVLYGAETLLAIVNIITKTSDSNEIGFRIGQDINKDADVLGYKNINMLFSKNWSDKRYCNFSLSGLTFAGWDAFDTVNIKNPNFRDNIGRNVVGKYYPSFFITANARYNDFNFQFVSYNAEQHDLGRSQRYESEGNRIDKVDDFMLQHLKQINKKLNLRIQFNYTNKRTARITTEGPGGNTDLSQTIYNFESAINFENANHYIQLGAKYQFAQNQFNYDFLWFPDDPVISKDTSHMQQLVTSGYNNSFGLYISEEWKINNKLKIVLASRLDYDEILKNNSFYLSPRTAIIYRPIPILTSKWMFNTSTHMPSPVQSPMNNIYGADKPDGVAPGFAKTNELASKPERLMALEWQNILSLNTGRLSLIAYYQKINDFISWFNPTTNMGNFEGYGFESEWKTQAFSSHTFWLNASISSTDFELTAKKFRESSNFPSNENGESVAVPLFSANSGFDFQITKNLNLSLIARYFTKQPAYFIKADPSSTSGRKEEWGYVNNKFYIDANLLYENAFTKGLNISLSCKNITNNKDLIAAQFRKYRYSPRGISIYFAFKYTF